VHGCKPLEDGLSDTELDTLKAAYAGSSSLPVVGWCRLTLSIPR
jgi:hypothetical protein